MAAIIDKSIRKLSAPIFPLRKVLEGTALKIKVKVTHLPFRHPSFTDYKGFQPLMQDLFSELGKNGLPRSCQRKRMKNFTYINAVSPLIGE